MCSQSLKLEEEQMPHIKTNDQLIDKVNDRILTEIPENLYVTPGTVPIPWFGDYDNSKACTISLNPSDKEFFSSGKLLTGDKQRFVNSIDDCSMLIQNCDDYFKNNPYITWFGSKDTLENKKEKIKDKRATNIEKILNIFKYSYYSENRFKYGTCVHLDIIQWATSPVWGGIPDDSAKEKLLAGDADFFKQLIEGKEKPFEVIFLNGKTVTSEFYKAFRDDGLYNGKIESISFSDPKSKWKSAVMTDKDMEYKAKICIPENSIFKFKLGESKVIGWTVPLAYVKKEHRETFLKILEKIKKNSI